MANPNLHLAYELEALGVPAAPFDFEVICAAAASEGGDDPVGLSSPVSRYRSSVQVTDAYAEILAVRVKDAVKDRVIFSPKKLDILSSTKDDVLWLVVLNPTGMAAGAWADVGGGSSLEVNKTRGAWGGPGNEDHIMEAGYFSDDTDAQLSQIASRVRPGVKADGSADVMAVMAVNVSAANAELIFATLHCDEFF